MASNAWFEEVLNDARREFLNSLPNAHGYDFSKFGTIDEVYDVIDDIQKKQSNTKSLKALKRIEPYIDGLRDYIGVMDTFAQVKPDIICLIWGPLKFILQLASSLTSTFQNLVAVLAEIGHMLPQFKRYAETGMFDKNDAVKRVMCLFYGDILDLHLEMLKFFSKKGLHMILESLWPNLREKLGCIQKNINSHKMIMTSNVTLEHVLQTFDHRREVLKIHEEEKRFQNEVNLKALSAVMSSVVCNSKLQDSIDVGLDDSGGWLFDDDTFKTWLNSTDSSQRCILIQGIPGAGKTILVANAVHRLKSEHYSVLFAFLSHDRQSFGTAVPLLHSLIFQAIDANHALVPAVHDAYINHGQDFTSQAKFVKNLFCNLIDTSSPLLVIIDGLDEIGFQRRGKLLEMFQQILQTCENIKFLLSFRPERDIVQFFKGHVLVVKVHDNNKKDIEDYVREEGEKWTAELQILGADDSDCAEIKDTLMEVSMRAKGMFLYIRLVLSIAKAQIDLDSIRTEMSNLPDGLDQAYGRILSRIKESQYAKKVLQWMVCAKTPLREAEVLQALLVKPLLTDFQKQRKAWVDVQRECGPIIEIRDGVVRFVHFTAQEYLTGKQSENFLNMHDGQFAAALTCLTYFCFSSFDRIFQPEFNAEDEEDLQCRIICGDFIFFQYAVNFWLEHVRVLCHTPKPLAERSGSIAQLVVRLYKKQKESVGSEGKPSEFTPFFREFEYFNDTPKVQQLLAETARFLNRLRYAHITPEGNQWMSEDPTMLSMAKGRFQSTLESMLTECDNPGHPTNCLCKKLSELYGTNVFKCKWIFCQFYLSGFSEVLERDAHEKTHRKLFPCPESSCPFASLGFLSKEDLTRHTVTVHPVGNPHNDEQASDIRDHVSQLAPSEIMAMLEHAVIIGNVELARAVLAILAERSTKVDFDLLLQLAAWKKSASMIDLLVSETRYAEDNEIFSEFLENALFVAIEFENIVTARALLENGAKPDGDGGLLHLELRKRYFKPMKILYSHNTNTKKKIRFVYAAFGGMNEEVLGLLVQFGADILPTDFIAAIKYTTKDQLKFLERLSHLKRFIPSTDSYSYGILIAVIFDHSIALEICLEEGGDPNFQSSAIRYENSALYEAVQSLRISPSYIKFVKPLLRAGADPYPISRDAAGTPIQRLPGMKQVEKYFGIGWDELVLKTQTNEDIPPVNIVSD